jgi:LCP family protein required for cell wall assembly
MVSDPKSRREPSPVKLPLWALALLAMGLLLATVAGAIWLFDTVRNLVAVSPGEMAEYVPSDDDTLSQAAGAGAQQGEVEEEPLPVIVADELKPWSGSERVNILFLGTDKRCEEAGPDHSDTLMLATIDPQTMSAALLSLPRDLWVEIPGFSVDRINQAYYMGEIYEYPGGGAALAEETVEDLLGVPVDYYVTVNFQSFEDAVNLVGGIVVDVPEDIEDPDYPDNCYGYEPFRIKAGKQRLDGATALKYARTRATLGGDVDRAQRQQAVLLAIRDQVLKLNQLPLLIGKAPQLWRTFRANVTTNLSLEDSLELALLSQDIPHESIRTAVLDYDYVYIETTPDGRQVLVPRRDEIRKLRDEIFAIPAVPTPVFEDLLQRMEEEDARVAVYNGTAVFGLAAETEKYLQDLGVEITEIGNADSASYNTTQIVDYGSHPYTTQFLIQEMRIPPLNLSKNSGAAEGYDILVIIGNDWAGQFAGESAYPGEG